MAVGTTLQLARCLTYALKLSTVAKRDLIMISMISHLLVATSMGKMVPRIPVCPELHLATDILMATARVRLMIDPTDLRKCTSIRRILALK